VAFSLIRKSFNSISLESGSRSVSCVEHGSWFLRPSTQLRPAKPSMPGLIVVSLSHAPPCSPWDKCRASLCVTGEGETRTCGKEIPWAAGYHSAIFSGYRLPYRSILTCASAKSHIKIEDIRVCSPCIQLDKRMLDGFLE
jgi:hypothetical protein